MRLHAQLAWKQASKQATTHLNNLAMTLLKFYLKQPILFDVMSILKFDVKCIR